MRATDGAIEACTLDKDTMEPTLRIVGEADQKAVGICGSGIIDIISELFRCSIINAKGLFVREGRRVRWIITAWAASCWPLSRRNPRRAGKFPSTRWTLTTSSGPRGYFLRH